MAKRYIRLNWQNAPSVATPINATNLNKMDKGINDIDTALNNLENSIVGQIVDDPTKINNAAVIYSLSNQVDTINNNLPALGYTNEGIKNSTYRGKYLGNMVTASQYTAISSGTFTDLYVGDYWTIGGINYRIAAFNYYYNTGDAMTPPNHITIVPDTELYTHVMNDTSITNGGYVGSKMYTEGLEQAKTTIKGIFSTHLIKHRRYLCNAVVDGKASDGAWLDSEIELMNEMMVYGAIVNGSGTYGLYNVGVEKSQLPLFALNPRMVNTRQNYWLRDVSSAATFARVNPYGNAFPNNASAAHGVRPVFSIS